MIKLSRLHGVAKSGAEGKCYKIICAKQAFHGRTFGGMSATPQEKISAACCKGRRTRQAIARLSRISCSLAPPTSMVLTEAASRSKPARS